MGYCHCGMRDLDGGDEQVRRLCHDISGSTTTIRHLAELIGAEPQFPAGARSWLAQLVREAERASESCSDVLDQGDGPEPVRLDLLAAETARTVWAVRQTAIDCALARATVTARRVQVRRLVSDLLDNASRAAGPAGVVRVTVGQGARGAWFEVSDSGPCVKERASGGGLSPLRGRAGFGCADIEATLALTGGTATVTPSSLGGASVLVYFGRVAGELVADLTAMGADA